MPANGALKRTLRRRGLDITLAHEIVGHIVGRDWQIEGAPRAEGIAARNRAIEIENDYREAVEAPIWGP